PLRHSHREKWTPHSGECVEDSICAAKRSAY
ncbi:unnamed protein product, partial [marine sediment metagenome]